MDLEELKKDLAKFQKEIDEGQRILQRLLGIKLYLENKIKEMEVPKAKEKKNG